MNCQSIEAHRSIFRIVASIFKRRYKGSELADLPSGQVVVSEGAGALTRWRDGFARTQRTSLSIV